MMPLWMTTTRPWQSACGCAFSSDGWPWVAHRVCPIPTTPVSGVRSTIFTNCESFPADFRTSMPPLAITATPAESYPRYSRRRSPSSSTGTAGRAPIYPMMPHM